MLGFLPVRGDCSPAEDPVSDVPDPVSNDDIIFFGGRGGGVASSSLARQRAGMGGGSNLGENLVGKTTVATPELIKP